MDHPLDSLVGLLALQEPFGQTDEELHAAGKRYQAVFGPIGELPENFGAHVQDMMKRYRDAGLRPA